MKYPTLQPILWVCVLLVLGIGTAQAQTTRFVDDDSLTGNTGDCSVNPCKTIGYALGQANDGDTIQIADGTYPGGFSITKEVTLQPNLALTTLSSGVLIDATGFPYGMNIESSNVVVDGLEIYSTDLTTYAGIQVYAESANLTDITLTNNTIRDITGNNPNSVFTQGYGMFGVGADNGSGGRYTISGLEIYGNMISAIGGGAIGGGEITQGNGIFFYSIGPDGPIALPVGAGAYVHGNTLMNIASGISGGEAAPSTGVIFPEDGNEGPESGILVENNTYNNVFAGAVVHGTTSAIDEARSSFTNVSLLVASIGPIASVDETDLGPAARIELQDSPLGLLPGFFYYAEIGMAVQNLGVAAATKAGSSMAATTITLLPGTYTDFAQVVIDKDVDLVGSGKATTIVQLGFNTGTSGDARGWYLVEPGFSFNVSDLTFDGNGQLVWQAVRYRGTAGSFTNVGFEDIQYNPSTSYQGVAVAAFGTGAVDFTGCMFTNIGRVGVLYFGTGVNGSVFDNNMYTGKGDGDFLDYALDISAGAEVTVSNNTIAENRGVASSDGSTSAGILVTTFFGAGTSATVEDNTISNSTTGVFVGFDSADTSNLTATGNGVYGNGTGFQVLGGGTSTINQNCIATNDFGVTNRGTSSVDAENNFWGTANGPGGEGPGFGDPISLLVDADPFEAAPIVSIPGCTAKPIMTVVVDENSSDWGFLEEIANGSGSFEVGPDTPPLGTGSVKLTVDATGRMIFGTLNFNGQRLDELTNLEYDSYRQTFNAGNILAPTLQFNIDYDLTDGDVSWQGRLVFEPYLSGPTVPEDTWQNWNPLTAASGWYATGAPGNGVCTQGSSCSLADVLANFPNAGVHATLGGTFFKAGGPWSEGFMGNVDRFVLGTSSVVKIFDFEPDCGMPPSWDGNFTGGVTVGGGSANGRGYMLVETGNDFAEVSLNLGQSTNIALLNVTRADGTMIPSSDLTYTNPLSGPDGSGYGTITYTGLENLESVRIYVTWLNEGNSRFMYQVTDQCGTTLQVDPAMAFGTPEEFELNGNYPNPFNPQTTIRFTLPEAANVTLEVFDVMGRRIQTLVSGRMDAGFHSAVWNGTSASGVPVASGIYLYRIQAGDFSAVQQMILMK